MPRPADRIARVIPIRAGRFLFVRVETEDGLHGIGEAGAHGALDAAEAAIGAFAEHLVGQDAGPIERHRNVLQRFGHFRGAAIGAALSAIDIALWDLPGKRQNRPVAALLGGPLRTRVRVYGHVKAPGADAMVAGALRLKADGFPAIGHLNPFLDEGREAPFFEPHARLMARGVALLERLRDEVGDGVDLCVELHRRLSPAEAMTFIRAIEPVRPLFVEDPIPPDGAAAMARLARQVPVPIATGERFHNLHEFGTLLRGDAAEYLRPSLCLVGGITAGRKIAAMAKAANVRIVPHNPLSPVGLAAAIHLAAAIPNFAIQEYPNSGSVGWETDRGTRLRGEDLVTAAPTARDGFVDVPTAPGLGTDLIDDVARLHPPLRKRIAMRPHADGFVVDQ